MATVLDHFRLVAPHYDRIFAFQSAARLKELLCPCDGLWVLDAGGGTGRVARTLMELTPRIVVLDESAGMLREARDKGLIAVLGAVEALPFRAHAFPRMLMVDAFHHLRDQNRSAADLVRTLAPGGRLVMQEPDIRDRRVKLTALAEKLILMRSHFRSAEAVRQIFTAVGVRAIMSREDAHFWAVVEKGASA
jgi:ubiquinone/menaquinone biosynthesis C-methylase UbiE